MSNSPRLLPIAAALLALSLPTWAQAGPSERLSRDLVAAMGAAQPNELVPAYMVFAERFDARARGWALATASKAERRSRLVADLKSHAERHQAQAISLLRLAQERGDAELGRSLWMANALLVEARPAVLEELANLPGVARIGWVRDLPVESVQDATAPAAAVPAGFLGAIEVNIINQQAPALWALGYDGDGVLVGSIDSGVQRDHPDLVGQLWENSAEIPDNGIDDDANGYIDDVQGWDFIFDDNDVTSGDPHGTQSAGLIVGDGTNGRSTGMAPGAQLVVCRVNNAAQYWEAQQYLFELGVDLITSSYSYKWPDQPDYHVFRALTDVELAGGVAHSNSIGNQGLAKFSHPVPFNIATPGNVPSPFEHPASVSGGRSSVIACGAINLSSGTLNVLSSTGPAAWEDLTLYDAGWPHPQNSAYHDYPFGGFGGAGPGLLKPDMTSYTNVMTTSTGSTYSSFSGTSASTPQLAGALALLREVQPAALPRHLDAALQLSAIDLGPVGKDVDYGAGLIAAYDAARRLVLLLTAAPQSVALGATLELQLRGEANANVYLFLSAGVQTGPKLNLSAPYVVLPPRNIGPTGSLDLPVLIPNDPMLLGVTAWLQAAAPAGLSAWGPAAFFSVPEAVSFGP